MTHWNPVETPPPLEGAHYLTVVRQHLEDQNHHPYTARTITFYSGKGWATEYGQEVTHWAELLPIPSTRKVKITVGNACTPPPLGNFIAILWRGDDDKHYWEVTDDTCPFQDQQPVLWLDLGSPAEPFGLQAAFNGGAE